MAADVDVAIVGAGPTGLCLALLLANAGRSVIVLERHTEAYPLPRAVHFDGEVARLLQACGLGPELPGLTEPADVYEWRNGADQVLLRFGIEGPSASGWPAANMFNQPDLEEALRRQVEASPHLELRFGSAVTSFTQDAEMVTLTTGDGSIITATFMVGCDGANSPTREGLGIPLEDHGFFFDWLVVDVSLSDDRTFVPSNLQICDPVRPTTVVSGGPGRRRWEFMCLPGETLDALDDHDAAWELLAPWDVTPANAEMVRHAGYRFRARWATRWHDGRVILAGDAAHQTPPFAGQGMCTGIRDAANLAWRLDLILSGGDRASLLAEYDLERIPHAASVIGFAIELGKVICIADPDEARARDELMAISPDAAPTETPALPGLEAGTLLASPGAGELVLQARVRRGDAEGLLDDVVGLGWRLLCMDGAATLDRELLEWFTGIGGQVVDLGAEGDVVDLEGSYGRWLSDLGARCVLQRPDAYAFGTGEEPSVLVRALRTALGEVHSDGGETEKN